MRLHLVNGSKHPRMITIGSLATTLKHVNGTHTVRLRLNRAAGHAMSRSRHPLMATLTVRISSGRQVRVVTSTLQLTAG